MSQHSKRKKRRKIQEAFDEARELENERAYESGWLNVPFVGDVNDGRFTDEDVNGYRDLMERFKSANYVRFREAYYQATGTSVDNATKAEIFQNIAAILQQQPDYLDNEMIIDFLERHER